MGKIRKILIAAIALFASLFLNTPAYAAGSFVISAAHVGQVENDGVSASIVKTDGMTFTHKTVFNQQGWVDYAITLKNNTRNTRRIDDIEIEDINSSVISVDIYKAFLGNYIDEEYDGYDNDVFGAEIKPGEVFTLIITFYTEDDPSTPDETTFTGDIVIDITYTDTEIGEEETESVLVTPEVPDTGIFGKIEDLSSDTFLATVSLSVMSVGLAACTILILKKHPKAACRVAIIALSVIAISPLAVHAEDATMQLKLKGEIEINTVLFMTVHYRDADSGEWMEDSDRITPDMADTIGEFLGDPAYWPAPLGFRAVKFVNTVDGSDVNLDTELNRSFDLTVVYEEIPVETYNITYDLNGGRKANMDEVYPSTYTNVETTYLPSPVSDDYDFNGWLISTTESVIIYDTEYRTGNLHLIAQWREKPKTFYNITYMQEMTSSVCSWATTPKETASQFTSTYTTSTNYIPRTTLIDERDGKEYTVVKLADGRCWMASNLRLGGDEPVVLTSDDSDVDDDWTLPASDVNFIRDENNVAFAMDETYGGFYNWYAATAGSGNNTYTNTYGRSVDNARYSICPKGWKLPDANNINNNDSEIRRLSNKYNSETTIQNALTALNITMSGVYSIQPYNRTYFASWSSATTQTTATLSLMYRPEYYGEKLVQGGFGEYTGLVVRCINR